MSSTLINKTRGLVIAGKLITAKTFWERSKGLLGHSGLETGTAMWISPCGGIHTCFMKFSIDAIFVDRDLIVRRVYRHLKPWRLALPLRGVTSVFELPDGGAQETSEGDQLHVGH